MGLGSIARSTTSRMRRALKVVAMTCGLARGDGPVRFAPGNVRK
jgi:hypothetical protein